MSEKFTPSMIVHYGQVQAENEALRAQVATLTAERNRLSELWGESQAELARVKALVEGAPAVAYELTDKDCDGFVYPPHIVTHKTNADSCAKIGGTVTELIARPNLEQKP